MRRGEEAPPPASVPPGGPCSPASIDMVSGGLPARTGTDSSAWCAKRSDEDYLATCQARCSVETGFSRLLLETLSGSRSQGPPRVSDIDDAGSAAAGTKRSPPPMTLHVEACRSGPADGDEGHTRHHDQHRDRHPPVEPLLVEHRPPEQQGEERRAGEDRRHHHQGPESRAWLSASTAIPSTSPVRMSQGSAARGTGWRSRRLRRLLSSASSRDTLWATSAAKKGSGSVVNPIFTNAWPRARRKAARWGRAARTGASSGAPRPARRAPRCRC